MEIKDILKLMLGNTSTDRWASKVVDLLTSPEENKGSAQSRNPDNWNDFIPKAISKAKFCGECEAAQPISAGTGFLSDGKRWCVCHSREVCTIDTCK